MMNKVLRQFLRPLPRLVGWYLSGKRNYKYQDLSLEVFPGVFHPGIFFSTKMLLQFVELQSLENSSVLELGAGTGIISLRAARMGARVTATDISQTAIFNIQRNAVINSISLTTLHSDLFDNIPAAHFDWILINPPYYPKKPRKNAEFAWYCGEHHEYFEKFFRGLRSFITPVTHTIMVLSDVCDLQVIFRIGRDHGMAMEKISEKNVWVDGKNYLFRIKPIA